MAERSRVAFNYQPFRDHYVVYSVLYPYDKDKSLLQWGSVKTLCVEVYQISYHSRISYSSNRRQQATANKFVRRVFLSIYERHAGFVADSVSLKRFT